jgi:hypothetical protein
MLGSLRGKSRSLPLETSRHPDAARPPHTNTIPAVLIAVSRRHERDRLAALPNEPEPTAVRLHRNLPELHHTEIKQLGEALRDPSIRAKPWICCGG